MVRIKHRYLLLNILYPSSDPSTSASARSKFPPSSTVVPNYLNFHAPSPPHLTAPLLIRHLRDSIQLHFGDHGVGVTAASLKCIYLSAATSTAIVRCPRAHFRLVWAALTFINSLPAASRGAEGRRCVVRVVRVSGTIRKAEEEAVRRARREIVRAKMAEEAEGGKGARGLERFVAASAVNEEEDMGTTAGTDGQELGIEDYDEDDMDEESD